MTPNTQDPLDLEAAAEAVHVAYLETCARLGWAVKPSNQVPYSELSEDSKELDRASVRAVIARLSAQPPVNVPIQPPGHLESILSQPTKETASILDLIGARAMQLDTNRKMNAKVEAMAPAPVQTEATGREPYGLAGSTVIWRGCGGPVDEISIGEGRVYGRMSVRGLWQLLGYLPYPAAPVQPTPEAQGAQGDPTPAPHWLRPEPVGGISLRKSGKHTEVWVYFGNVEHLVIRKLSDNNFSHEITAEGIRGIIDGKRPAEVPPPIAKGDRT